MSKDEITKTKIETAKVREAIESLKSKDWDLNPYTVADELEIDRDELVRNADAMAVIIEARGNDCTFTDPQETETKKILDLEKTLEELEKENNNLAQKIAEMEEGGALPPPEDINNQVMQLLQSESQDEIKQLEEELSRAYSQVESKQEEVTELTRTVSGLEKVNEALNQRLRELEDANKKLEEAQGGEDDSEKSDSADLQEEITELTRTVAGLEQVNEGINQKLRELEQENSELKEAASLENSSEGENGAEDEKDEKIRELTITVSGLERVNEAINLRMRELEDQNKELSTRLESGSPEQSDNAQDNNKDEETAKKIARLEKDVEQLNDALKGEREKQTIISMGKDEVENKLAELQKEADAMALQLQNSFHLGYEKGLAEGRNSDDEESGAEATGAFPSQELARNLSIKTGAAREIMEAEDNPDTASTHSFEGPVSETEETVTVETMAAVEPVQAAPGTESEAVTTHNLESDERAVINFTQDGPYVSSDFNPLQDLRWRDLETVYDMGVLSPKDINRTDELIDEAVSEHEAEIAGQQKDFETDTSTNLDALQPGARPLDSLDGINSEETQFVSFAGNDYAPNALTEDQIQENLNQNQETVAAAKPDEEVVIPDFDQMDIFEDIEELEELGKIEVPDDMLADVPVDEVVKEENVTGDELQALIKERIKKAQEHTVEQTVRTPPAPGQEEAEQKGFSGLNKFVGQNAQPQGAPPPGAGMGMGMGMGQSPALKAAPREIVKACRILGITPEDLTKEKVNKAWKDQIASPGVHPDLGGDTEAAVILNSAKDELLRFIESSAPKLGKKFGGGAGGGGGAKDMSNRFTGKKKQ